MVNLTLNVTGKINVLCLGAHCDDIEIGCGGTLLKLKESGRLGTVRWMVFSSTEVRKQEALVSAESYLSGLAGKEVLIHSFRDGFLPFQAAEVKDRFEELKAGTDPDIIFTHYRHDRHQDHRLISDLTWNTFRNHFILEYEIPKWDGDLGVPNTFVGLEEDILDQKIRLLFSAYATQAKKHWFDSETFKALPRIRGMESSVKYAEAFYLRKAGFIF